MSDDDKEEVVVTEKTNSEEVIAAKTPEDIRRERFDEALTDTFNITLPHEAFKSRAYRGRREKFYTIGCGNLRHPEDSIYKGRKVRAGDRIPNNPATQLKYFKSAYDQLFPHISENLDMDKMSKEQLVAVSDLLYNRGPACLTRDDFCLAKSINVYLNEPSVKNGILTSLYMTAKRDAEKDMKGLRKRRDQERKMFFGENADKVIEATDAIKTVPWKELSQEDLTALVNLVAECGPDCLTAENAELPKIINAYVKNPSDQNKQNFSEEIQHSYYLKFVRRPAEQQVIDIPDIKDVLSNTTISTLGINALLSDQEIRRRLLDAPINPEK